MEKLTRRTRPILLADSFPLDPKMLVGSNCEFSSIGVLLSATSVNYETMRIGDVDTGIVYTVSGGSAQIQDWLIVGTARTYANKEAVPYRWDGLHVFDEDTNITFQLVGGVEDIDWVPVLGYNFIAVTTDYVFAKEYNWHNCTSGNSDYEITVDVYKLSPGVDYTFTKVDNGFGSFTLRDLSVVDIYALEVEGESVVLTRINDEIKITFK